MRDEDHLVTVSEIARLAGTKSTAVSNWRRRHHDTFPRPEEQAPGGGALFSLNAVIQWLDTHRPMLLHGRADDPVWRLVGRVKKAAGPEFVLKLAAELVAARTLASTTDARKDLTTQCVVSAAASYDEDASTEERVFPRLAAADAEVVEEVDREVARPLVASQATTSAAFELLIEGAHRSRYRWADAWRSGRLVRELVVRLTHADSARRVFDPAAGEAGFLVEAVELARQRRAKKVPAVAGQEIDEEVRRLAIQRLIAHEIDAEIELTNAITDPASRDPRADVVVCEPSVSRLSSKEFGDLLRLRRVDRRIPPEFVWIRAARERLADGGHACVVLRAASTFRDGVGAEERAALLRDGAVEAVVTIPSGSETAANYPLALWLLRDGARDCGDVLLVDASDQSHATEQETDVVETVVRIVEGWRSEPSKFEPTDAAVAVPTDQVLDRDANLLPRRWLRASASVDPARATAAVKEAQAELRRARAALESIHPPPIDLDVLLGDRETLRLLDAAELISGARLTTETSGDLRVLGPWDFRGEPRRYLAATRRVAPRLTEAGDVIVLPEEPAAFVDTSGGNAVATPLQIVRPIDRRLDPHLLAALIANGDPDHFVSAGSGKRINPLELELAVLPEGSSATIVRALAALTQVEVCATEFASRAKTLRQNLATAGLAGYR